MFLQHTKCEIIIQPKGSDDPRVRFYRESIFEIARKTFFDIEGKEKLQNFTCPLKDDWDNNNYEKLHLDPSAACLCLKYQKAIEVAIKDKIRCTKRATKELLLIVTGSGCGELIAAASNACVNTEQKLKILVIAEKQFTISPLMEGDVKLIAEDWRSVKLEEKADILVLDPLELFGPNEMSAECVEKLMKPDGACIPSYSTSHIRPVMTSTVGTYRNGPTAHWSNALSAYFIDEAADLFSFCHSDGQQSVKARCKLLVFKPRVDCIVDGFAGFFTSILYKQINIQVHLRSRRLGIDVWNKGFFPVVPPLNVRKGESITVEITRRVDLSQQVKYEMKIQSGEALQLEDEHPIVF